MEQQGSPRSLKSPQHQATPNSGPGRRSPFAFSSFSRARIVSKGRTHGNRGIPAARVAGDVRLASTSFSGVDSVGPHSRLQQSSVLCSLVQQGEIIKIERRAWRKTARLYMFCGVRPALPRTLRRRRWREVYYPAPDPHGSEYRHNLKNALLGAYGMHYGIANSKHDQCVSGRVLAH